MRLALLVTGIVVGALLAACGAADGPGDPATQPFPTPFPGASPPPDGTSTAEARVRGEIMAVSDVEGEGERPMRDGVVLVMPEAQADAFWAETDRDPPPEHQLPYWNPNVPRSAVTDLGGVIAPVDDGRFSFDVPAGDYLVCLANGDDPLHLQGCARGSLSGDDRLRATSGEGGFELGLGLTAPDARGRLPG